MALPYDSLLTHPAPTPLQATQWYEAGSLWPATDVAGELRAAQTADTAWVVGAVLAMTLLLLATWRRHRQYLSYRLRDFFTDTRLFSSPDSGSGGGRTPLLALLCLASCASLALMGCELPARLSVDRTALPPLLARATYDPAAAFLLLLGGGAALLLAKAAAYALVNWTFFSPRDNSRWMQAWLLLTALTAAPLLAAAVLQVFGGVPRENMSIFLLLVFIVYNSLLFYKLKTNFRAKKYGNLLILLYLCTLEIAPALVAWRFFELHSTT